MNKIVEMILSQMGNQEPVLGKAEMKAVALATISQNFAVAARRGRPIFASNLVKDMGAFNNAASGGIDLTSLLMLAQAEKAEATDTVDATAVDTFSQRLDAIEAAVAKVAKAK